MKKKNIIISLVTILCLLVVTGCGNAKVKNGDEYVVEMKGSKVTASEFYNDIKVEKIAHLVDMMDHKLFDKKYATTDTETKYVEEQLATMKKNYANNDDDTFQSIIKQYFGYNSVEELEDSLHLDYKRQQAVYDYIEESFSDKEVENYYNTYVSGDVKASHILIESTAKSTDSEAVQAKAEEKAKQKAEDIIKRLNKGEKFADLAKKYSNDEATKDKGGDLGTFSPDDMTNQFAKAVKDLKTNEYTKEPIKTTYGYEIILKTGEEEKPKLEDKEEEIRNTLREQALQEDSKLYYNSLVKLREDKGIKWNDSKLEKAYKEYNENLLNNNSKK